MRTKWGGTRHEIQPSPSVWHRIAIVVVTLFTLCVADVARVIAQGVTAPTTDSQILAPRRPAPAVPRQDLELPSVSAAPVAAGNGALIAVLAGVDVVGATVFPEAELAALYQTYLGRRIGTAEIAEIITAITAHYHEAGYVLSYAVAKPQDLAFGILRIDVVEGYVERVVFEGTVNADRGLLEAFAAKLRASRPLTQGALERYVLLINDLPGVDARPALRRNGALAAGHDLVLTLSADRFEGRASIDNRGTDPIGRNIAELSTTFNSAFGLSERTGVYLYTVPDAPHELRSAELMQEYVVNGEGLLVGVDGWYSRIEPGAGLRGFDLVSEDARIAVYVSHPVERSRAFSLFVTGTLEYRDTAEETAGINIYDDRIRSARLAVRGFFTDRWGAPTCWSSPAAGGSMS